jgi:hypothetical protein
MVKEDHCQPQVEACRASEWKINVYDALTISETPDGVGLSAEIK